MARMPGAQWYPKAIGGRALRRKGRGVAYHVAVAEAQNLRPGPNADWHFYVARDGTIYQYIDTDFQAWTTGNGNGTMIGVETQGGLYNTETEKWSDAALDSLARIAAWAHETEGIPLRLMQSSRPEERGLGWHKLGVDPWRVAGGELWSSARGKTCPGAAKIAQMPEVLRRAQMLVGGSTAEAKPILKPEGFLMALSDKQQQDVYDMLQTLTKPWATQEDAEPRAQYDVVGFARKADAYGWRIHYRQIPALMAEVGKMRVTIDKLVDLVSKGDADVAEAVRQAIADTKVQVQIVGIDGDTPPAA